MESEHQLKQAVADSGISDSGLQPILKALTELGKKLRKEKNLGEDDSNLTQETHSRLQAELRRLLGANKRPDDWINPLLTLPG